jgi:virginiamycin A acetyltransferase
MKRILKGIPQGISLALTFPLAVLCAWGRIEAVFTVFAQMLALAPGLPGDYLRSGFYCQSLRRFSINSRVSFGSFFAQSQTTVVTRVYIGTYCVIGSSRIGDRTQIASHVQVLSGRRQHGRDEEGRMLSSDHEQFTETSIGNDCWIGASAIIMADIGDGATVGAGSVVVKPIPPGVVAVGNPARVVRQAGSPQGNLETV